MLFPAVDSSIPDITDSRFNWQALPQHRNQPQSALRPWLLDSGSLTDLLINHSDNQFRVQLVAEEWLQLNSPHVMAQFGPLTPEHRFWSRKVVLMGRNQAWVCAHTLIPEHSLLGPLREVLELHTRPLGEYLFSHPQLLRCEMDFSPFAEQSWGRRSLFFLFGKPIMVAEFFLPEFCQSLRGVTSGLDAKSNTA